MINYPKRKDLLDKVDSPYTLIILAARRARQINISNSDLLEEYRGSKPVSKSLEDIAAGKITYRKNSEDSIK